MRILTNVGDHSGRLKVPNRYNDVVLVQKLLNNAASKTGNAMFKSTDPPDGKIHSIAAKSDTVKAIYNFQVTQLNFKNPDGIGEPGGVTFRGLLKFSGGVPATKATQLQNATLWDWPLDSNKIRRGMVNHTFGYVRTRNGRPRPHQGWDFYAVPGTQCYAIADGTVQQIKNHGDYGKQVILKHKLKGKTIYSHYAHLQSWSVETGQVIRMGEKIGKTGNTGNASTMRGQDQHLHFEIRTSADVGLGLTGRQTPKTVFGICPMKSAQTRKYISRAANQPCYINPDGPKIRRFGQLL